MSKYAKRGAYHFDEFSKDTPYRKHMLDVIQHITRNLPHKAMVLDVGCGEGLLMSRLKAEGYLVAGCDIDPVAVSLGLEKGVKIHNGTIFDLHPEYEVDAVCMLDVLEHVKDFRAVIDNAKSRTDLIFIAIPDRPDAHQEKQLFPLDILSAMTGWEMLHQATRQARHFFVFKKLP